LGANLAGLAKMIDMSNGTVNMVMVAIWGGDGI
jgi:hypothetical protein